MKIITIDAGLICIEDYVYIKIWNNKRIKEPKPFKASKNLKRFLSEKYLSRDFVNLGVTVRGLQNYFRQRRT